MLLTVPLEVPLSEETPVTPVKVIKSVKSLLFDECCTLTIQVPDDTANDCKYATEPLLVLAELSIEVMLVAEECVTLPAVPEIPHSSGVPVPCTSTLKVKPPSAVLEAS